MKNSEKESALETIGALANEFDLTAGDIDAYLQRGGQDIARPQSDSASNLLIRVLSYIGGTFVFAGIAIFIGLQWDSINSLARVIVTLGTGCAVFAMAVAAMLQTRFQALAMPLMLIAAVLQPTGMMVAFAEFGGGGDEQVAALITAITFAVQFGLVLLKWRETMAAWLTIFFTSAFWGLLLDLMDFDIGVIGLTSGLGWLCLGLASQRSLHTALSSPLFFLGCWAGLAGLFDMVEASPFEAVFVLANCGLIYLGVWAKSRVLNFASTIALLAYTAYFTGRYFSESTGWPIALILIGLLMIGLSSIALRIDRKYLRQN